jgi:large repetitive protein
VYAYTEWTNGHQGSTHHDTRVEGLNGNCGTTVTPVAPTFMSAQCTAPGAYGDASYLVPAVTGVQYQKSPNGSSGWVNIAKNGYTLSGNPNNYKWTKDFDAPNCIYDVTPPPPTFTDAVCTGPGTWGQGSYTIPAATGVRYLVSINDGPWVEKAANVYPVAVGTKVEVDAEELPGYDLTGQDSQWQWWDTISKPSTCDQNVTPTKPVSTQAVCTGEGQVGGAGYTIPSITGVKYERWTGSQWVTVAAGTYPMADGSSVWIRAVELAGYELQGSDDNYKWELEFADVNSSKCVVPANPTPTHSQCTAPGQSTAAKYNVPNDTGIQYQRWNGASWVNIGAGDVAVANPAVVQLRAVAKAGYTIVGGPYGWEFTFTEPDCIVKVVPSDPTFTDAVCEVQTTGTTQGGYVIPTTANVSYSVSLNGAAPVPATTGAFVPTSPGDQVTITATAASGYSLKDYTGPWSHTFATPGACIDEAPVGAVTKVDQTCVLIEDVDTAGKFGAMVHTVTGSYVAGWITIPSTPNVDYFIEPDLVTPATAGDHLRDPGVYTVHAVAHPGYVLTGYSGPWVLEIVAAEPCGDLVVLPTVTPVATFVQAACVASGSYTLGVEEPGLEAGVVWTVTGGLPNTIGTHSVASPGSVTVQATPAVGYGFTGLVPFREWTFVYTAAGDCLPTLALTGGGSPLGGLGLSALLVLGGILLIRTRERMRRPAE